MLNDRRSLIACFHPLDGIARTRRLNAPRLLAAAVLGAVLPALLMLQGCGSDYGTPANSSPSTIEVMFSQAPPSPLQVASMTPVIATVANDSMNMGVDWQVSCESAKCGTFSPAHTASGAATTFIAPTALPTGNSVNITALSTADHSKNVTVAVALNGPPITIAFSAPLPPTSVAPSSHTTLAVTITNDVQNLGALWSVTCQSSSCGSFSLIQTPSGSSTVFTAPSSIPPGGTVTVTATSAADKSQAVNAVITIAAPPISVSLTPPVSPLQVGATGTASAIVSNDSTNAGVDWSVSCAGSSCGSFSPTHTASGASTVYTAPAAVPTGGIATITAASTADKTKSQSASITIIAGSGALSISFTTAPPASLQANAQASVIATVVNDSSNDGVNWSLTCGTGNTACGSLAFTHTVSGGANTFTAPASPPSGGTVTIIATAAATASASTPTTVSSTVAISSVGQAGLLIGQFAFYLAGTDSKGFYTEAGSVTLDGKGNVTGGEEDFADTASAHPTATGLTGTYSIGIDGRGTMTINTNDTGVGISGVETLSFVVVSSSHAQVIEFDTSATSIGSLDLQTASSFSHISIAGGYSFAFAGVDLTKSSAVMDLGGVLTADGKGNFSSVTEDLNDAGTPSAAAPKGTYTAPDGDGRGTATIGSATFVYYVVSSGALRFIETDASGRSAGQAFGQGTATFSNASFSGNYTFVAAGKDSTGGALGAGGLLTSDGNGNITAATVDFNNAGVVTNGSPTGTYSVGTNGRGTLTLTGGAAGSPSQFAFYLTGSNGILLLELDTNLTSIGTALTQSTGISAASFKGTYAGSFDATTKTGEQDVTGQFDPDGVSAITGSIDVNQAGGKPSSNNSISGSFTSAANGRFTGTISTSATGSLSEAFYVANSSTVQFAEIDSTAPATGLLELQQFAAGVSIGISFGQPLPPATLAPSATATMNAVVTNDSQNLGVNWTVSCGSSACGTFSSAHTASAASTTYTAPATAPTGGTVTITATAVADETQFVTALVTIGSGSGTGGAISIVFNPAPPTELLQGTSSSLTAVVSNDSTNAGVNWTVSCESGQTGSACGTLSAPNTPSGKPVTYTAPASVPNPATVTVTAAAAADPSQTALAPITITATPPPPPPNITIELGPVPTSLQTNAQTTISATLTNDTGNGGVDWSVACVGSSCGSFSSSNTPSGAPVTYTAPASLPNPPSVTITATAHDNTSVSVSTAITILSSGSPGLLATGSFVFLLTGTDQQGFFGAAGTIALDGKGDITAGEEDYYDAVNSFPQLSISGGTYTIEPDGHGTMSLTTTNTGVGVNGTETLSFTVVSTSHALVTGFDTSEVSAGGLDLQATGLTQASISGGYSFVFSGLDVTSGVTPFPPLGLGGVVTGNGSAGTFSGGTEDLSDAGTVTSGASPAGTFTALDAFGRGTATLGPSNSACLGTGGPTSAEFAFYVVGAGDVHFLETDGCGLTAGSMVTQGTTLTAGPYAFTTSGASGTNAFFTVAEGGVLSLNGGSISGTDIDVNNSGTVASGTPTGGTYSGPSNGRLTLNLGQAVAGVQNFAGYLTANGMLLLEIDSGGAAPITTGAAYPQASSISAPSLSGSYALISSGPTSTVTESLSGELFSDGVSTLGGSVDVNQLGTGALAPIPGLPLSGAFTANSNGRFTGSLSTSLTSQLTETFYVVNSSAALFIRTDKGGEATGVMQLQQFAVPPGIIVTAPPPISIQQAGAGVPVTALVSNDPANGGVDWTLSCGAGTNCGSITAHTASNVAATYTPPPTVPATGYLAVTVVATAHDAPNPVATAPVVVYNSAAGELVAISQAPPSSMTTGQPPVPLAAVVLNDTGSGQGVVTWANDCGGSDCGSFSLTQTSSGEITYYTPPASVPAPSGGSGTVTISAAAKDNIAAVATENLTITGNLGDITVAWSTQPPTQLDVGAQALIAAKVSNANDSQPTILYSCTPSGSCGTFTPAGGQPGPTATAPSGVDVTYTAPASVPSGGTVTITASSNDDPSATVSATVTIMSAGQNSLLNGQYAFSVSGTSSGGGFYTAAGSVTLANGVVTAGEEDYYDSTANNDVNFSFVIGPNSQYSMDTNGDGRGTMTLENAAGVGVNSIQTFGLAVVNSPQHALITEFDSSATSNGSLDLQTTSDLKMAAITGSYAFLFSGFDVSSYPELKPLAEGGVVTANGAGTFESGGVGDVNDNGKVTSNQALSGAYNNSSTVAPGGHCGTGADGVVDPCGRASATLVFGTSTYNYVYYIVNGGNIKFMDIDAASGNGTYYAVARGSMFTAATSFANGNYAFTALGAGKASSSVAAPPLSAGGVFAASNGAITSSVDVNNNGTLQSGTPGGTYSIGANGRGSITFTPAVNSVSVFEGYATASNGLLMLETDSNLTSTGTAWPQSATTFGSGNYAGIFDSDVTVSSGSQSGSGEEDAVGQVIAGTTGTFTGENMDINQLSFTGGGIGNQDSGSALGGTFTTTTTNGRYTGTFTLSAPAGSLNEIFYVVVGTATGTPNVLFIETDKIGAGTGPGTGTLELQNLAQ